MCYGLGSPVPTLCLERRAQVEPNQWAEIPRSDLVFPNPFEPGDRIAVQPTGRAIHRRATRYTHC
jgi:hypothetical protein